MSRDRVEEFAEQLGLVVARLGVLVILATSSCCSSGASRTSARDTAPTATPAADCSRHPARPELLVADDIIRTVAVTPSLGSVRRLSSRWPCRPRFGLVAGRLIGTARMCRCFRTAV